MQRSLPFSALVFVGACAGSPAAPRSAGEDAPAWHFLRARYDSDHDGRIQRAEYSRPAQAFQRLDADGDGVVSAADFDPRWDGVPRIEATTDQGSQGRWIDFEDFVHGEGGPQVGDAAPPFRLVTSGGEEVELATFRERKPVALVFGSFT